jgi:hypothetical protein
VAGATPCPKNGVAGPPHFWPRGGRPPHTGRMGVAEATPGLWGWSGHPERPKKKKNEKNGFGILRVAGPPPRAWRWPKPPLRPVGGVRSHPQALGGGPATPKIPNPFFFFFGLSGWPDHTQRPGVASATPIRPVWGGRPPQFLPSSSSFFFFF